MDFTIKRAVGKFWGRSGEIDQIQTLGTENIFRALKLGV